MAKRAKIGKRVTVQAARYAAPVPRNRATASLPVPFGVPGAGGRAGPKEPHPDQVAQMAEIRRALQKSKARKRA